MTPWILAIDQSAAITKLNHIGWAIFHDGIIFKTGELMPDMPHLDNVRNWLRETIAMISQKSEYPFDDVTVGLETCYFGKNVAVFQNLVSVKEQCHAVVRDMGAEYTEITPQESFRAITGRAKNIKGQRKEEMAIAFKELYDIEASSHVVDAVAMCMAIIKRDDPK